MAGRCVRLSMRQIDALITSLALPVLLMLMFVYLFGGAIQTGGDYVTYVVPGVILLCAGFGSATTAVTVSQDMTGGIVDRLRSMDVGGPAVLAGHVAASVVRNAASTTLVLVVALLIGFRPDASSARLARSRGRAAGLRAGDLVARGGAGPGRHLTRGRQRHHVRRDVPALRELGVRPRGHDAVVAPGLRGAPADHAGRRDAARAPARRADRGGHRFGVVRRDPRRSVAASGWLFRRRTGCERQRRLGRGAGSEPPRAPRTHPSMPQFQPSAQGTSTESSVGESRATMYSAGSESEWLTRMCVSRGGT